MELPFPALDLSTETKDLSHLQVQIAVGRVIKENPVVAEYLTDAINHITRTLLDSKFLASEAKLVKAQVLQCTNQIRAYEHLLSLAVNLEAAQDRFTELTTPKE